MEEDFRFILLLTNVHSLMGSERWLELKASLKKQYLRRNPPRDDYGEIMVRGIRPMFGFRGATEDFKPDPVKDKKKLKYLPCVGQKAMQTSLI